MREILGDLIMTLLGWIGFNSLRPMGRIWRDLCIRIKYQHQLSVVMGWVLELLCYQVSISPRILVAFLP